METPQTETKTMLERLPERLLDDEGYPTREWLQYLSEYAPDQSLPILTFIDMILIDGWWMPDLEIRRSRPYAGEA